jgi:hypothetical protein
VSKQTPRCPLCGAEMTSFDKEECRKFYDEACANDCASCTHGIHWICFRCLVDENCDGLEIDPDQDESE